MHNGIRISFAPVVVKTAAGVYDPDTIATIGADHEGRDIRGNQ